MLCSSGLREHQSRREPEENEHYLDVFGNELHRYSIADGIRDKNVLGFDPYMVPTYKERDLRKAVALEKAKAPTEAAAMSDPKKKKAYLHYMDHTSVPMAGVVQADGTYLKGIEDICPTPNMSGKNISVR